MALVFSSIACGYHIILLHFDRVVKSFFTYLCIYRFFLCLMIVDELYFKAFCLISLNEASISNLAESNLLFSL